MGRQKTRTDEHHAPAKRAGREVAIDPTPKPCLHPKAAHTHGTVQAWRMDRCRCEDCVQAKRTYDNERSRLIAYGQWRPLVDAEPLRAHLEQLLASGATVTQIARSAQVPPATVSTILSRKPGRTLTQVRRATAEKLMALEHATTASPGESAQTARTLLRAMVADGWPAQQLVNHLGLSPKTVACILSGSTESLRSRTIDSIVRLHADLGGAPPRATTTRERAEMTKARNRAAREGWATTAELAMQAYDEVQVDGPDVDEVLVERWLNGQHPGRYTADDRLAMILEARRRGWSDTHIESVTGVRVKRYAPRASTGPSAALSA